MNEKDKRIICRMLLSVILLLVFCVPVLAQEKFPARVIDVVNPNIAGGGSFLDFQVMQPAFEKAIRGKTNIICKPEGAGAVAYHYVSTTAPDGYTMLISNPSMITNFYTTKGGLNFDQFDLVTLSQILPGAVVVKADSRWKTFKEFLDDAKANPGKLIMGNSGYARMWHVGAFGIEMATGAKFTHVPYKGSGPATAALLGGHLDSVLIEMPTIRPFVEAKKVRILAVSSPIKNVTRPDEITYNLPIFKDFGFDLDIGTWYVYLVPKGTPQDRIKILRSSFKAAVNSEDYTAFVKKNGGHIEDMSPESLASFIKEKNNIWKKCIDFGGFKQQE